MPGHGYPAGQTSPWDLVGTPGLEVDGLWVVDTFSGASRLVVSLRRLLAAVSEGPLAGEKDELTGLGYHVSQGPPAEAGATCLHWVSQPQVLLPLRSPSEHPNSARWSASQQPRLSATLPQATD